MTQADKDKVIEVLASLARHLNGVVADVKDAIDVIRLMRTESEEFASKK